MARAEITKGQSKAAVRRVSFIAKVDGARAVILTGDFTNWAKDGIRLESSGDGKWRAQLELPAGEYRYRLLVDGQWRDHSEAAKRVPNPFGSEDCILIVP